MLKWWHLLSLDAPTVAALWSWFFLRVAHVNAPLFSSLLLALGTWLIYVADRILDGLAPMDSRFLRERHFFYVRHRRFFTATAAGLGCVLAWLVPTRMAASARREDAALFGLALLYFCLVHIPRRRVERWLPKELAVGVLFAAATAVPAWSRMPTGHTRLLSAIALFAGLCWLNCVAIERWETPQSTPENAAPRHPTTRWAAEHLRRIALCIALVSTVLAIGSASPAPYLASLLAACSFVLLDCVRDRVPALHLRIAADASLLTPLLALPFLR